MIWQHSCKWNRWHGEFVLECPSSEIQSISVAMEHWSVERWAFVVETYLKKRQFCHCDSADISSALQYSSERQCPSRNTVLLWVKHFREIASATKRKPPGREPSLRTPENIERVCQAFVRSPQCSASRNAIALRMCDHMVHQILHEDLNFHPYKMVMVQAVYDQDTVNRKTVCEVLLNALNTDNLNHVLMTDEANFHHCGNVNSQNCRYQATENPRDIHQKPLHSEKVIVCVV
jgi:hypothetical protein